MTTSTQTTVQLPESQRLDLALDAYTDLVKHFRRHADWQAAAHAYSTLGFKTILDGKRVPSKASKHEMYALAYRIHQLLGLPSERPHTLAEIDLLIRNARAVFQLHGHPVK